MSKTIDKLKTVEDYSNYLDSSEFIWKKYKGEKGNYRGNLFTIKYRIIEHCERLIGSITFQEQYPELLHSSDLINNIEDYKKSVNDWIEVVKKADKLLNDLNQED